MADSPFTNPQLPKMANWICLYCILVGPILCGISLMTCSVGDPAVPDENSKVFILWLCLILGEGIYTLVITIIQFIGGLRFRSLRKSGMKIIKLTLWVDIIFPLVLFVVSFIAVVVLVGENDFPIETTAQALISLFTLVQFVCVLIFEIFALIWLHKYSSILPLTED